MRKSYLGLLLAEPAFEAVAMHVFIVDDHEDCAEVLAIALQLEGFKVQKFTNFQDAYALITNELPCIALVDVHVPGEMDVLQFCNEVRKNFPSLPIIVISGDHRAATYAQRLNALFLLKPYDTKDIVDQVKRVCPRAKDRRT